MIKARQYLGMEVKKKGNGLFVDCGLLVGARSRKEATKILEEYASMKPTAVLTEKEAREMLDRLTELLKPKNFGKKEERLLQQKLTSIETKGQRKYKAT